LHITATIIAARGRSTLVATALPMELGASVHPFTKTTPKTSKTLMTNAKLIQSPHSIFIGKGHILPYQVNYT